MCGRSKTFHGSEVACGRSDTAFESEITCGRSDMLMEVKQLVEVK